jgi:hypothetical protein
VRRVAEGTTPAIARGVQAPFSSFSNTATLTDTPLAPDLEGRTTLPSSPRADAIDAAPQAPIEHALARAAYRLVMAAAVVLFFAKLIARYNGAVPWDDSWMFQRYARNLLTDHRIAWNPHGEPTYGLTSPLMLLVVLPLQCLVGKDRACLATLLAGTLSGLAFLALVWRAIAKHLEAPGWAKRGYAVVVAYCFATSLLVEHFVLGMDTTLALAFLMTYLLAASRADQHSSTKSALVLGAIGGLSFGVRPELCLFALLIPASFSLSPRLRRTGLIALGVSALMLAMHLVFNRLYFKTMVPLPFYAKATGLYGQRILDVYKGGGTNELTNFLFGFWPLFAIIALDLAIAPRTLLKAPVDRAALIGALACLFYYWIFALQVMGGSGRFFFPPLAALVLVAGRSVGRVVKALGERRRESLVSPGSALGAVLAMAALAWTLVPLALTAGRDLSGAVLGHRIGQFDPKVLVTTPWPLKYWFKLDQFSELPDDVVMATTEVGFPGLLNPRKTIIDMAGLNERAFAMKRFSADRLFSQYHPDLIYMPHPDYADMVRDIEKNPEFQKNYEAFSAAQLGASHFGIALRKDSKHYAEMRAIVRKATGR